MPLARGSPLGLAAGAAFVAGISGCGGGVALMHSAHTLSAGSVAAGAGISGQFILSPRPSPPSGDVEQQYLERSVGSLALAPGVAPWVGARAGLGNQVEAGLTYTGRTLRAEGRRSFQIEADGAVAVSIGAGASAVFARSGDRTPTAADAGRLNGTVEDNRAIGFGFDVPALIGWRSAGSIVEGWAGARGGVERASGDLALTAPSQTASFGDTRWYAGGLVGLSVGIQPLWVAVELDVAYQSVSVGADFPGGAAPVHRDATLSGMSVAPTGAVVGRF